MEKKSNFRPEDFKVELIETKKRPIWMHEVEQSKTGPGRITLPMVITAIIALILFTILFFKAI